MANGGESRCSKRGKEVFGERLRDADGDGQGNECPWQPCGPALTKPDTPDHDPASVLQGEENEVVEDYVVPGIDECGPGCE